MDGSGHVCTLDLIYINKFSSQHDGDQRKKDQVLRTLTATIFP